MTKELLERLDELGVDQGPDPFETWRRLREANERRATLIDLYALVALKRGLAPHELPQAERIELSGRALPLMWPGFELVPDSYRGAEPIELLPYDDQWPVGFQLWRDRLSAAMGAGPARVEHVGSTAVTGLVAKPIIDIQVSVADMEDEQAYVPAIEGTGLQLRARDSQRRYLRPPPDKPREVHVHVCTFGSTWEREHLLFRDYLRSNPSSRDEYAAVKLEAAKMWHDDRIAYTEAKTAIILDLLEEAERWAGSTGWSM